MTTMNRRAFVTGGGAGLAALALAGCENPEPFLVPFGQPPRARTPEPASEPIFAARGDVTVSYGPVTGEPFPIPAAPLSRINPAFLRTRVNYQGRETPGTIVVDPARRYLYLVQEGGRAMRYGVGVGREGFGWSGTAEIKDKQAWPDWYPPKEMIQRQPEIRKQVEELEGGLGVPGGTRNPLGARAMYLWQNGKDTLYRIHGTLEPWTIGTSVSSGCIRMINQDAIDLYERVPLGTKVVVLS
jgi:lipoprotein-anchoring transpeptidase ErfK/SrfK